MGCNIYIESRQKTHYPPTPSIPFPLDFSKYLSIIILRVVIIIKGVYMKFIALLFLVLLLISSCATPQALMKRNNAKLLKLEIGMPKEEVIQLMGQPVLNEAYQSLYGKSVVIFFYYTQRKWSDGNYTKDECTPVVFENGKLVGWGGEFYKNKMEVNVNIKNK